MPDYNDQSFFIELQAETQDAQQEMLSIEQIVRGVKGQISLNTYTGYLTEAYHHVKHTVPLLMACGSRLESRDEWLRNAIADYIKEELGHQEWILNDLKACGADSEKIRNSQANSATELMVAYAYDTVQRKNPVGFFGMVYVLEGTSIALATNAADAIKQSLNLPSTAFSYLSSHGSLDIDHMQFFEGLMKTIKDHDDQQAIIHMANMMFKLYGDVFRSIPLD